jgi:hypothetical protein
VKVLVENPPAVLEGPLIENAALLSGLLATGPLGAFDVAGGAPKLSEGVVGAGVEVPKARVAGGLVASVGAGLEEDAVGTANPIVEGAVVGTEKLIAGALAVGVAGVEGAAPSVKPAFGLGAAPSVGFAREKATPAAGAPAGVASPGLVPSAKPNPPVL